MTEAVNQSRMPQEMKQAILNELPEFIERIDEATQKVFSPSAIWLESAVFADYVIQMAKHILEGECEPGCNERTLNQLIYLAENWKDLAENSMQVLDSSEAIFNAAQ